MSDLMTIGDFSARSGVSPKRLRNYAARGLLVPVAVDSGSGYRYYSPHQLLEARLIDALRAAGVPVAEIPAILRDPSQDRFDGWATRVELDAAQRQAALDVARILSSMEPTSCMDRPRLGGEAKMRLTSVSRTDIGCVRDDNEDAVVGSDHLAVVADGMGGHPAGALASTIAADLVQAAFTGRSLDELRAGVRAANRAIWERAEASAELAGMGTTLCAAGLTGDGHLVVVNVGDSRASLLRNSSLTQLTGDHTVTAELVRRGELDEETALDHPQRGILTRALGVGPDVELDSGTYAVAEGDRLVLCTDGLSNEVPSNELASRMTATDDLQGAADALIELALSRGGHDNVSVVLADITA